MIQETRRYFSKRHGEQIPTEANLRPLSRRTFQTGSVLNSGASGRTDAYDNHFVKRLSESITRLRNKSF
jgi:hypothetical protein